METHEISAHRVIDALNTIHREWSTLSPEARMGLLQVFNPLGADLDTLIDAAANKLTEQHPFEPVTDEQRQSIFENMCDMCGDMSAKDNAEMVVDEWSEWQWRCEQTEMERMEAEDEA